MADPSEELEPLFDYSRVQPCNVVCLDDDSLEDSPIFLKKRRLCQANVEKKVEDVKVGSVIECDDKDEEDWLPPPPKISVDTSKLEENSTIKELRLKKQELALFAKSAQDVLRDVEETVQRDFSAALKSSTEIAVEQPPPKPACERAKIVISIQDKDGLKQFRVYKEDKLERLFKMYADKVKLDTQSLSFSFDGDKIGLTETPEGLGMEDDDIIEVRVKSR